MKKLFFLPLLLFLFVHTNAQSVYGVEMDSLQLLIEEEPAMYHEIAANFHSPDTSQEFVDILILYYGSAFRANYSPYGEKTINTSIWEFIENEEFDKAIQVAEGFLNDEPANTTALRQKAYAYLGKEDTAQAELFFRKYYELLSVPFNSGDGKSAKSAFVVRSVDDEYAIVALMDADVKEQALVNEKGSAFDVMEVELEDGTKDTIWFNIDLPFGIGLTKMFDLDEEEGKGKRKKKKRKKKKKKLD